MEKFHTKKKLGQNFLTDSCVLSDIADAAGVCQGADVIEIGPGLGALTEEMLNRGAKVTAVEIDDQLIPILRAKFATEAGFQLIHADFLETDLGEISQGKDYILVGNLPYYITTPIIQKVLHSHKGAKSFTIMVQKEVAERLSSPPGAKDYGVVPALISYYAEITYIRDVDRTCFSPQPNVDSSVIRLDFRSRPPVEVKSEETFFAVIKQSFSQRRKTLANSLCGIKGLGKEETRALLAKSNIDPMRRAETLTLQEFANIANNL